MNTVHRCTRRAVHHEPGLTGGLTGAWLVLCMMLVASIPTGVHAKGLQRAVLGGSQGAETSNYAGSYALVIGVSNYTAGWTDLESIPGEVATVERMLQGQGFVVRKHLDLDSDRLQAAFESFIDDYGYEPDNRLLVFFSGHGHTRMGGRKGYLVPTDAPDPRDDERGFLRKALPMSQILAWAWQAESRHLLFLFDSCFSGTVFKARPAPEL